MILKKIILKNIRSYESAEVNFPNGSVLLSGDIGSGKTSVLLGIEFALFGLQPGQKGASLLRHNAKEGYVCLELEIDDKNIIIERTLKRSKAISQEEAKLTIDNETKEMSVTELKNKILELIDYPVEFIKKSNMLYRFTVYTPQEEMKQIILESSDARLDTLRHVFGIDKYRRIKENAEIVRLSLREEIKNKQGMILDLPEKTAKKTQRIEESSKLRTSISEISFEFLLMSEKRKQAEAGVLEIRGKIEEKQKLENEIEKTTMLISGKREMLSSLITENEKLESQIKELEKLSFNESEILNLEKEKQEAKKQVEILNRQYLDISGQISSLNLKNSDSERLKSSISKIDHCPTCLQDVDANYKANIINKSDTEITANKKKISELNQEISSLNLNLDSMRKKISECENKSSELRTIKIKLEAVNEKKTRITEIEKQKSVIEKDFSMLEKHISSLKEIIFTLSKYDLIFKTKESELESARKQEKNSEIRLEGIKKELSFNEREILELNQEINRKEEIKKNLSYLISLQEWITTNFLDIISFTEANVLLKLREQFSKLFNEWFNMLVPEIFTVRLDDSFTPVIEQQDYELDYNFLSGGERTAIALAYRLALNQTINSLLSKIKTKDIVILDEPTDGFSEQQLDKMRDVLNQLKVKQLILVSHESKIESFVENIIKFKKEAGITRVEV